MICPNCDESMEYCDLCANTRIIVTCKEDWDKLNDDIKQILINNGLV